jgi:hypothetical protein
MAAKRIQFQHLTETRSEKALLLFFCKLAPVSRDLGDLGCPGCQKLFGKFVSIVTWDRCYDF